MTRTSLKSKQSKVKASQAITLLLAGGDKLYYYEGEPNYKDYTSQMCIRDRDYAVA